MCRTTSSIDSNSWLYLRNKIFKVILVEVDALNIGTLSAKYYTAFGEIAHDS